VPVQHRLAEFWASQPSVEAITCSRLAELPLLQHPSSRVNESPQLTAKEHLLLEYLQFHAGEVCGKDDLIRAVWPEDRVFSQGVRDDSLAQLVRRLRQKIEPDPNQPRQILVVPGRGYRYCP
jgi:DNA-binding winged helix-turn-helix (wHTH) protein